MKWIRRRWMDVRYWLVEKLVRCDDDTLFWMKNSELYELHVAGR